MKKLFALSVFVLAMVFTTDATAQKFSALDKSPLDMAAFPTKNNTPKAIKFFF